MRITYEIKGVFMTVMFFKKFTKSIGSWALFLLVFFTVSQAQALTVDYTLDNIVQDNGRQLTGTFTWTYDPGDFEGGTGLFSELSIPSTIRPIDQLNISFDIANSIEFSLAANLNNVQIDVSLFFLTPLTPTQSATLDLTRSKFEVFDPGGAVGVFVSGTISPVLSVVPLPASLPLFGSGLAALGFIGWRRKKKTDITA